jgi:hypothetical protein
LAQRLPTGIGSCRAADAPLVTSHEPIHAQVAYCLARSAAVCRTGALFGIAPTPLCKLTARPCVRVHPEWLHSDSFLP